MTEEIPMDSVYEYEGYKIKIKSEDLKIGNKLNGTLEIIVQFSDLELITTEEIPMDGEGSNLYELNRYLKKDNYWVHNGGRHIDETEYNKIIENIK